MLITRKSCVLLRLVQEFVKIEAWLLLVFSFCLHSQISSINFMECYSSNRQRMKNALTKVKYTLSILQIYFKYFSSILQLVELQKKEYTTEVYIISTKRSSFDTHLKLNQHFNLNLKYTRLLLHKLCKLILNLYVNLEVYLRWTF